MLRHNPATAAGLTGILLCGNIDSNFLRILLHLHPAAAEKYFTMSAAAEKCAACGKGGDGLKTCNACKLVKYCNARPAKKRTDHGTKKSVRNELPSFMMKLCSNSLLKEMSVTFAC